MKSPFYRLVLTLLTVPDNTEDDALPNEEPSRIGH